MHSSSSFSVKCFYVVSKVSVLNFHVIQCTTFYLFLILKISVCRSVTFSSRLLFGRIHLEGFVGNSPEEIIRKRLGGMRRKIE